jgi:hypothetical protein
MMVQKRFGRKMPLPSTMEIKRELVLMGRADSIIEEFKKEGGSEGDLVGTIKGLIDEHRISPDQAQMLINRSGYKRAGPSDIS